MAKFEAKEPLKLIFFISNLIWVCIKESFDTTFNVIFFGGVGRMESSHPYPPSSVMYQSNASPERVRKIYFFKFTVQFVNALVMSNVFALISL